MSPPAPLIKQVNRNDQDAQSGITPIDLGERIKEIRKRKGWSLEKASISASISRSSLFKIEKGKMSPTFDAILKIAKGFDLDVSHLLVSPNSVLGTGRRSITRANEGSSYGSDNYQQTLLAADFANKSFIPFKLVVTARAMEDFPDWDRHESEDFLYVLSGATVLYTEFYEPLRLEVGDSIYYDGRMGHVCVSVSEKDAEVLWVTSS
ncbi:MAG: transcriptional regulator with XRE-family HTH domain [Pseudohongiellaceae bacterium]|jgi:transcriptional regulator with XRE-family HTH domain